MVRETVSAKYLLGDIYSGLICPLGRKVPGVSHAQSDKLLRRTFRVGQKFRRHIVGAL